MGLRGPKPKARELLKSRYYYRPGDLHQLKYKSIVPDKPAGMSPSAERIWDRLVSEMASARVLQNVDFLTLGQLCRDEALLQELESQLPKKDLLKFTATLPGRRAMQVIHTIASRVAASRKLFGLDPQSRIRLTAAQAEPKPNSDEYMADMETRLTSDDDLPN